MRGHELELESMDDHLETIPDELVGVTKKSHHQIKLDVISAMNVVNNYRGISEVSPRYKMQDMLNTIIETDDDPRNSSRHNSVSKINSHECTITSEKDK